MVEHTSWLVSITPKPHGSYITPGGVRYEVTIHDGATTDMVADAIAVLDNLADILTPANGNSAPKDTPRPQDAPTSGDRNDSSKSDGMDIYGVGWRAEGDSFTVLIERMVAGASSNGNPKIDVFAPGHQFPDATIYEGPDGRDFAALKHGTGKNPNTLKGEYIFDAPIPMVFQVGKKKQSGNKHYWDFVSVDTKTPDQPADNGAEQPAPGAAIDATAFFSYAKDIGYADNAAALTALGIKTLTEWSGTKAEAAEQLKAAAPKATAGK